MNDSRLPSVSVIIPTHDRDRFLERAVRSAATQTHAPREIIVVDDLARDSTRELVARLANETGVMISYLENAGRTAGAPGSRNIGSRRARGEYLAFLDDDDTWAPKYLDLALTELQASGSQIVITGFITVDDAGNFKPGKLPPENYNINDYFLRNPGVLCSNVIVNSEIFEAIKGYDASVKGSCDKDLFMRLVKAGYSYKIFPDRLVNWFVHSGQWSKDERRLLPSVVAFYRKYWTEMPIQTNIRVIVKIARLTLSSCRSKSLHH